ncbi:type IX secretion system protein PorG [Pleomorphovibrio marinus]|uniref:type IX secretion system protein PorG n=1 Tax=Pleomorphovibrio marinus TaxID=2164132 RepID=UPI000E0C4EC0|nr:DUF6089 family protein [Pleomorphovibrio marinus]
MRYKLRNTFTCLGCLLVWFFHTGQASAQQYEVGFGLGGATYTGDIIRRIDPTQIGLQGTLFGRRNFDNAWTLRAGISVARLNAADSVRPIDPVALSRNAYFNGTMLEASAVMEFHFIDYLAYQSRHRYSPYGFFGLGYGMFFGNGMAFQADPSDQRYRAGTPVIPFGMGIKYKLKDRLFLSLEAGIRATFTDNLDKINNEEIYYPRFVDNPDTGEPMVNPNAFNFGNIADRDWYYFLGISLSYSFHQVKCFN